METSVLTSKGQLLIPKRLRTKYGFKGGMKVVFKGTDKGLLITPMDEKYFQSFVGILKGEGHFREEIREMKEEEKALEERKMNFNL